MWELKCGIFNVQHAPVTRAVGATGGVQQERTHEHRVTREGGAEKIGLLEAQLLNAFRRKTSREMRPGQDAQRAVGFVGIVEMKTNGEHLLE